MRFIKANKSWFIDLCEDEMKPMPWAFENAAVITVRLKGLPAHWKIGESRG